MKRQEKPQKTWVEKYRPKTIDSIVQQNEIKSLLSNAFKTKTLTHMLLHGPPGTGKTTTALTISRYFFHLTEDQYSKIKTTKPYEILNDKIMKERVLELNASDDNKIKVVRDKIKSFAMSSVIDYEGIANFKIIILDEADALTSDSQFALRRIIEKYTDSTRFILICNYVTKIIPPLASRCMKLRFQTISTDSLDLIIKRIGAKENLQVPDNFVTRLNQITKGDLRESINLLERVAFIDTNLSSQTLDEVSGQISEEFINNLWSRLIDESIPVANIIAYAIKFKNSSYSSLNLLEGIFLHVIKSNLSDKSKAIIITELSKIDYYLNENANEYIQLVKLFGLIKTTFNLTTDL
jgi:DNA polymerase III delta prime subunit